GRSTTCNARFERDLGTGQGARDGAVLRLLCQLVERSLSDTRNVAHRAQLDAGDVETGADLSERHPRGGAQIPRGMARLAQQVRERDFAFLDAPGGSQVPDEVGEA